MEFNITSSVENLIVTLIGGGWGRMIAKYYRQSSIPINFAIVLGLGILIQTSLAGIGGMFGSILSYFAAFAWDYLMTVGPMGHIWGFGIALPPPVKKPKKKVNPPVEETEAYEQVEPESNEEIWVVKKRTKK